MGIFSLDGARGSGFRLGFGGLGLRVSDLGLRFREGR